MVSLEFAKNRKAGNPKAHNFKKQGEYMKRTIPMLCSVLFLFTVAADCEAARLGGRTTIRPSRPTAVPQRTYPRPTYRSSSPAVRNLNNTQSGSAAPMPIFIPPVIGRQNLIKIADGFYVIKTGIRRKGDEVYFWTMQNRGFIPDSKSSKIQYVIDCAQNQYAPLAIAAYAEADGKGAKVKQQQFDRKMRPIVDKSTMSVLYKGFCKKADAPTQSSPAPQN